MNNFVYFYKNPIDSHVIPWYPISIRRITLALFLSTIINKLDKKGRVSVPAQFRNALAQESFSGVVLFRAINRPVLEGCGYGRLEKLSASMSAAENMQPFSEHTYTEMMFAEAQLLSFDAEGRITMPHTLLEHARISDHVTFVGRGPVFEIWSPEQFEDYHTEVRERLVRDIHTQKSSSGVEG